MRPTAVPSFWLVEWLKVFTDLAEECMECDLPWHDCLTCPVTVCQRWIDGWLRY